MASITLRKALQNKKTLTGDICKLKGTIEKFNSQEVPNKHINLEKIHAEFDAKVSELIILKTAITKANIGIYEAIVEADEVKAKIALYEGLNTTDSTLRRNQDGTFSTIDLVVHMDYSMVENKVKELKERLLELLDKIDHFNSNTMISV